MDPNILLATQTPDTGNAVRQSQQDQQAQAMNSEQILQAHYQNMNEREKARLTSTVTGAVQLKQFLDNNDLEGAHNFLQQRRQSLQNRMSSGENVDTQDTDEALNLLRSGRIEELQNGVNGLMAAGMIYGITSRPNMPANLQEWQAFQQMTPEQQQQYLNMKRSGSTINLGGTQLQLGADGKPIASHQVTPKPDNDPDLIRRQEAAKLEGRGELPANEKVARGRQNLTNVLNSVRTNYDTLNQRGAIVDPNQGAMANIGAKVASSGVGQAIGGTVGTEEASIRQEIQNQRPALINAIRDATGMSAKAMDSNTELQFYLQQATDPNRDIRSNLAALNMLEQMYGVSGTYVEPQAPLNVSGGGSAPQRVIVSNGQETFEIDASDLAAAQQEGYNEVR